MNIISPTQFLHNAQNLIDSKIFANFLAHNADRKSIICSFLKEHHVPHKIVTLKNRHHIIIKYGNQHYSNTFKKKTITAHYDRCEHTEGANDNSAACLQLMYFAVELLQYKTIHNIKIIFTDGEEAGSNGLNQQGAFLLGSALRQLKLQDKEDIFVFDLCGKGNCLIISQSGIFKRETQTSPELIRLHKTCCRFAKESDINHISLPTPYSDNAGFIATGITAQTITMLPQTEIDILTKHLTYPINEELANLIITNTKPNPTSKWKNIIPATWQTMHTQQDSKENLEPQAFIIINKFLHTLAHKKYI